MDLGEKLQEIDAKIAQLDNRQKRMLQAGIVTDIDRSKRRVRAQFQETNIPSGWLYVLQQAETVPVVGGYGGSVSVSSPWLPRVGDWVLVLYPAFADSDGYVLGVIA